MSENESNAHKERSSTAGAAVTGPENDKPWGKFPSQERRDKLDLRLAEWASMSDSDKSSRLGPFNWDWGKNFWLSGADVFYLAARSLVQPDCTIADATEHLSHPTVYQHVYLPDLHLEHARLRNAHLEHAVLRQANLEQADLIGAHLEGAYLWQAHLEGADLRGAYLDAATVLREVTIKTPTHGTVCVADVHWGGANLAVVQWTVLRRRLRGIYRHFVDIQVGDEGLAWEPIHRRRLPHSLAALDAHLRLWQAPALSHLEPAARANRQLAAAMRDQGMNDEADHFAYRAQVCQRDVYLQRLRLGRWLFSWLLFIIAGYGYRPLRTLFWYAAIIVGFALAYMHFGHINGQPFEFDEALVFSVTSFHGRGFFPGTLSLKDVVTKLAAAEAMVGLLIEFSFIATFTQRFFGK